MVIQAKKNSKEIPLLNSMKPSLPPSLLLINFKYFQDTWGLDSKELCLVHSVLIISYWITLLYPPFRPILIRLHQTPRRLSQKPSKAIHCTETFSPYFVLLRWYHRDPFPVINFFIQHCSNQCVQVLLWKYIISYWGLEKM